LVYKYNLEVVFRWYHKYNLEVVFRWYHKYNFDFNFFIIKYKL